jgi:FKBP-type peptidyl-prolyl cis-trans isomerase
MMLPLLLTLLVAQTPAAVQTGKLQIKDVKVGSGPAIKNGDQVTVDYTGKLSNGQQFDSSVGGDPFTFIVGAGQVIKGWDQGLVGAKAGGKRSLVIPSFLGYGAEGAGPDIPPNSALLFDIEIKKIESIKVNIRKKGSGESAMGGDTVQVHYTGMFTNGKKFDSSRDEGEPMEVTIGQTRLVPGFTMGLIGMKIGEQRRITIPPALGYGDKGAGNGVIPPKSTLVFDLELVSLEKAQR